MSSAKNDRNYVPVRGGGLSSNPLKKLSDQLDDTDRKVQQIVIDGTGGGGGSGSGGGAITNATWVGSVHPDAGSGDSEPYFTFENGVDGGRALVFHDYDGAVSVDLMYGETYTVEIPNGDGSVSYIDFPGFSVTSPAPSVIDGTRKLAEHLSTLQSIVFQLALTVKALAENDNSGGDPVELTQRPTLNVSDLGVTAEDFVRIQAWSNQNNQVDLFRIYRNGILFREEPPPNPALPRFDQTVYDPDPHALYTAVVSNSLGDSPYSRVEFFSSGKPAAVENFDAYVKDGNIIVFTWDWSQDSNNALVSDDENFWLRSVPRYGELPDLGYHEIPDVPPGTYSFTLRLTNTNSGEYTLSDPLIVVVP